MQNKIWMVYPVSWTSVCYVTVMTLFIKKVGVIRPNFGGVRTPDSPVVAPLAIMTCSVLFAAYKSSPVGLHLYCILDW